MKTNAWKQYSFEFLSIFVAVIAAFALNNWNDNRKDRIAERKILMEIYNGIQKDIEDLEMNKYGHEMGLESVAYFKRAIGNQSISSDSALFHYFSLTRDFISIQNTSGYETLQSRGLELIENDSLRSDIISLYEYDYNNLRKLEEEYRELQFFDTYFQPINELLSPHFQLDTHKNVKGLKLPIQLSEPAEKRFASYLWRIETDRRFVLGYYIEVEEEIEEVKKAIEQELGIQAEQEQ